MKQADKQFTDQEVKEYTDPVSLYDRYGSMVYGIILQIIPEPELAQVVLIDLFASPPFISRVVRSAHPAGEIIRLARTGALAIKSSYADSGLFPECPDKNYPIEKHVFELSFCQGYSLDVIAQKFQLSRASVLKSIFTYVKQLRSS